jgi:hypothetical protein
LARIASAIAVKSSANDLCLFAINNYPQLLR